MSQETAMMLVTDDDALWAFRAFGVAVRRVYNKDQALAAWEEALSRGYSIVFITETLAGDLPDLTSRGLPFPVLTVLPGGRGGSGLAAEMLRRDVVRALGADILASSRQADSEGGTASRQ